MVDVLDDDDGTTRCNKSSSSIGRRMFEERGSGRREHKQSIICIPTAILPIVTFWNLWCFDLDLVSIQSTIHLCCDSDYYSRGMMIPRGLQIVPRWIFIWMHSKSRSRASRCIVLRSEVLYRCNNPSNREQNKNDDSFSFIDGRRPRVFSTIECKFTIHHTHFLCYIRSCVNLH